MATYSPGKLNYIWQYLSSTLEKFKVKLLGYRTYKALLNQSTASDPTAVVLENTLGLNPTFVYIGTGEYSAIVDNILFASYDETTTGEKVEVTITPSSTSDLGGDNIQFVAYPTFFNVVTIQSINISTSSFEDDLIGNFCSTVLEIKVYNK